MHATKKSVTTLAARHVGLWHVPTDQHPSWSDLRVLWVSCRYVFITCSVWNLVAGRRCLQKHHYNPQTREKKKKKRKKKKKNRGFSILTTTLLSDKYRYIEQELLFFGISRLQQKDCPYDGQPMKHWEPYKTCKAYPYVFSLQGPSAPFSKRPVCGFPTFGLTFHFPQMRLPYEEINKQGKAGTRKHMWAASFFLRWLICWEDGSEHMQTTVLGNQTHQTSKV